MRVCICHGSPYLRRRICNLAFQTFNYKIPDSIPKPFLQIHALGAYGQHGCGDHRGIELCTGEVHAATRTRQDQLLEGLQLGSRLPPCPGSMFSSQNGHCEKSYGEIEKIQLPSVYLCIYIYIPIKFWLRGCHVCSRIMFLRCPTLPQNQQYRPKKGLTWAQQSAKIGPR